MAFQMMNAATVAGTSINYNSGVKIKQEPVMTVQTSNGGTRKQPFIRENFKRQNSNRSTPSSGQTNPAIDVDVHLNRDI